jgi:hypothetical protein
MPLTYIGNQGTRTDNDGGNGGVCFHNVDAVYAIITPTTSADTYSVDELSAFIHRNAGSGNVRLAIYSSNRATLICYGTSQKALAGVDYTWQGHMFSSEITWASGTALLGGTHYTLAFVCDDDTSTQGLSAAGTSGSFNYALSSDYTEGSWPSSLAAGTAASTNMYMIRAGLTLISSGGTVTKVQDRGTLKGILRGELLGTSKGNL